MLQMENTSSMIFNRIGMPSILFIQGPFSKEDHLISAFSYMIEKKG